MHSLTVIRGTHYEVTYVCYEFIVGGSGFLTCFNANVSVARDICGSIDLMPSLYARRYHGCLCNPSVRLLYRSWRRPSVLAWSMLRMQNPELVFKRLASANGRPYKILSGSGLHPSCLSQWQASGRGLRSLKNGTSLVLVHQMH